MYRGLGGGQFPFFRPDHDKACRLEALQPEKILKEFKLWICILIEAGHPVYEYGIEWFFEMADALIDLQKLRDIRDGNS